MTLKVKRNIPILILFLSVLILIFSFFGSQKIVAYTVEINPEIYPMFGWIDNSTIGSNQGVLFISTIN